MKFEDLDFAQQSLVLRKVLRGKEPVYKDELIKLPKNISIIYICSSCSLKRNVNVYTNDFDKTIEVIKCDKCGGMSRRTNFGTETMFVLQSSKKTKRLFGLDYFFGDDEDE